MRKQQQQIDKLVRDNALLADRVRHLETRVNTRIDLFPKPSADAQLAALRESNAKIQAAIAALGKRIGEQFQVSLDAAGMARLNVRGADLLRRMNEGTEPPTFARGGYIPKTNRPCILVVTANAADNPGLVDQLAKTAAEHGVEVHVHAVGMVAHKVGLRDTYHAVVIDPLITNAYQLRLIRIATEERMPDRHITRAQRAIADSVHQYHEAPEQPTEADRLIPVAVVAEGGRCGFEWVTIDTLTRALDQAGITGNASISQIREALDAYRRP